MLPEDCISAILSFTSPIDVCRSSMVSNTFRSALDSDIVWDKFLPPDYLHILSKLVLPFSFSSKKELFLRLCDPVLIDDGKLSFRLEKSTGKKCYILSARELSIRWSDVPMYWCWVPTTGSRFSEVAVLRTTSWLEIRGKIRTKMLSPKTKYGAYLIMKITDRSYGLDAMPSEISVEVGNKVSSSITYLCSEHSQKRRKSCQDSIERMQIQETNLKEMHGQMPSKRDYAWSEIELGEFFSGECDEEVKMSLTEVKGCQLKGGLVIEGIEIRPKQ